MLYIKEPYLVSNHSAYFLPLSVFIFSFSFYLYVGSSPHSICSPVILASTLSFQSHIYSHHVKFCCQFWFLSRTSSLHFQLLIERVLAFQHLKFKLNPWYFSSQIAILFFFFSNLYSWTRLSSILNLYLGQYSHVLGNICHISPHPHPWYSLLKTKSDWEMCSLVYLCILLLLGLGNVIR